MKKKILLIVLAIVLIAGSVVAYMTMTGAEVTEDDNKQGSSSDNTLSGEGGALANPDEIEMPSTDSSLDTISTDGIIDEEFNPEDML